MPAQPHFIIDRRNDFVEIARDDGERAKFWTALEDDWSCALDFTPETMQKLKNYYYTMPGVDIERGFGPRGTNISEIRDANVNEQARSSRVLRPAKPTLPRTNDYRLPCLNSAFKLRERQVLSPAFAPTPMILTRTRNSNRGSSANGTSNEFLVDVPGLVRSELRTVLVAGDLVHARKTTTKGKGEENAFDDP
ncbi:hypothetical protein BDN71DRAFT_1510143 [Pleurotus eryngii]|uniref:Uncharacterized protein n=1 Tax=Pleurotus eryngii TaxID=5323 RepID=A0A9P6DDR9_PLEER|nr:hypothetical protein BDN71DRAFT_1510143 [Pleurotus eryngii]